MQLRSRILYIQKPLGGGTIQALFEMVRCLDKSRFQPVILCYELNVYTAILNELEVEIIYLNNAEDPLTTKIKTANAKPKFKFNIGRKLKRLLVDDIRMARRIKKIIVDKQIDLIHHNTEFPFCRQAMLANLSLSLPQVSHYRSLKQYDTDKIFLFIDRYLASTSDYNIYISYAVKNNFTKLFSIPVDNGTVIRDIIDNKKFKPNPHSTAIRDEFKIGKNAVVLSCIGRIIPWKGQHIFIEALAKVTSILPGIKALIVGPYDNGVGSVTYYETLLELVKKHALEDVVIFTGHCNDIPEVLAASDIVIHSSISPEPQGLVIVEALFYKKPVIVSDAGGAAELIIENQGGIKVKPGSVDEMYKAIVSVLNKIKNGETLPEASEILKDFDSEEQIGKIESIYERLLKTSRLKGKRKKKLSQVQ